MKSEREIQSNVRYKDVQNWIQRSSKSFIEWLSK